MPILLGGRCSEQRTTENVVRRYFEILMTGDAEGVNDCLASKWRPKSGFDAKGAQIWAAAGPLVLLDIFPIDTAHGCDRFDVRYDFAKDVALPWSRREFFTVGPDADGKLRIHETGTGLAGADKMTVACP